MCEWEHYTPEQEDGTVKPGTPTSVRHGGQLLAGSEGDLRVYDNGSTVCAHYASNALVFELPKAELVHSPAPKASRRRAAEE